MDWHTLHNEQIRLSVVIWLAMHLSMFCPTTMNMGQSEGISRGLTGNLSPCQEYVVEIDAD